MKIKTLCLGKLETNCYIIYDDRGNAIIIDPADETQKIIENCNNLNVKQILVTHHHFDHVGALKDIEEHYHLKHNVFKYKIFDYEVINTPGHTDDSISFYFPKAKWLFCGDFIFKGSIGRFDFRSSNFTDMQKSLIMISNYPDDITVFPGHGDTTKLGLEKNNFKYYL